MRVPFLHEAQRAPARRMEVIEIILIRARIVASVGPMRHTDLSVKEPRRIVRTPGLSG
jgi:hypothetical protein